MKKWKNKEHSSLPKSITERTMFFKMQNFPVFGFLRISTSENEKKCWSGEQTRPKSVTNEEQTMPKNTIGQPSNHHMTGTTRSRATHMQEDRGMTWSILNWSVSLLLSIVFSFPLSLHMSLSFFALFAVLVYHFPFYSVSFIFDFAYPEEAFLK